MTRKKIPAAAAFVFALLGVAGTLLYPGENGDGIIGAICLLLSFVCFVWLIVLAGTGNDKKPE